MNVRRVLVESLYDECVFLTCEASPSKEFGEAIYFYTIHEENAFLCSLACILTLALYWCNFTACKPSVDHHALHGDNILHVLTMQN